MRMHYGHPDFMDAFWAANRGSVSKASPHINLSEDIFAGLNVKTRHEQSLHTDYLEWEKGREVQFLAGSGFFWKIASGSVGLLRTRDLRALCQNASVMETFALYFATVAWYIHNVIVDISTEVFLLIFIYLTLASKSISDLGELGSMLAAEWFLTPAFSAMLPAIIGLGIEYGPFWMFKNYLLTAPMSMIYFIFINKAMSSSVRTTFEANTAEYVNTGRPHANKSYTLMDAFLAYWNSQYRPALQILYCIVLLDLLVRLVNLSDFVFLIPFDQLFPNLFCYTICLAFHKLFVLPQFLFCCLIIDLAKAVPRSESRRGIAIDPGVLHCICLDIGTYPIPASNQSCL